MKVELQESQSREVDLHSIVATFAIGQDARAQLGDRPIAGPNSVL